MHKSKLKTMQIFFFFWPREDRTPGMTVNEVFYCKVLRMLRENVWRIGHRNDKTRKSLSTTTMPRLTGPLIFLSFRPRTTWQWSPILTRSGSLWIIPLPQAEASDEGSKIRHHWKDSRWIAEGTWHNSRRDFQGCFQAWQKRWDRCICAKGEYFDGDGGI